MKESEILKSIYKKWDWARWLLTTGLAYMVTRESGTFTSIAIIMLLISNEIYVYVLRLQQMYNELTRPKLQKTGNEHIDKIIEELIGKSE